MVNRVGAPPPYECKMWDCVPRGNLLHFFVKARFRTSKPASQQPIAASTLHVIAPPVCLPRGGPQLPHVTPVPFTMPLGGPGFCFGLRQAVYEGSHECRHPLENVISVGKRAGR